MSEKICIVGAPECYIPGSKKFTCSLCGGDLYLALAGQSEIEKFKKLGIEYDVICMNCAVKNVKSVTGISACEGSAEELLNYLHRN